MQIKSKVNREAHLQVQTLTRSVSPLAVSTTSLVSVAEFRNNPAVNGYKESSKTRNNNKHGDH